MSIYLHHVRDSDERSFDTRADLKSAFYSGESAGNNSIIGLVERVVFPLFGSGNDISYFSLSKMQTTFEDFVGV